MTELGEEVEAQTALDTSGTSTPLSGVALGDECLNEFAQLSLLVEAHLAMLASVDDASDVRNGYTRLRNVSCCTLRSETVDRKIG